MGIETMHLSARRREPRLRYRPADIKRLIDRSTNTDRSLDEARRPDELSLRVEGGSPLIRLRRPEPVGHTGPPRSRRPPTPRPGQERALVKGGSKAAYPG